MIDILKDLVRFKTVYPNYSEVEKCFDYIKKYFEDTSLFINEFSYNNEKSLVISNSQDRNLDIIFCGHIDVVPADETMFEVKCENDILYGRGVADMKGQVATMMKTMKYFKGKNKVGLILTSDEERGGFNGVKYLLEKEAYTCKIAIIPDGGANFELVTEEKGVLQIKISIAGKESHSALLWEGENAIEKIFDIYSQISKKYPKPQNENEWLTTVNLAKIECDNSVNKVPKYAEMYLDIRHIHSEQKSDILDFIQNIDKEIKIEILAEGESFHCDTKNQLVCSYLEICESVLKRQVDFSKAPSASDARFFSNKNITSIIMNPVCGNLHCNDEYADYDSFIKLYEIYMKFCESEI